MLSSAGSDFGVDLLVVLVGDDLLDLFFLVGFEALSEFAGNFLLRELFASGQLFALGEFFLFADDFLLRELFTEALGSGQLRRFVERGHHHQPGVGIFGGEGTDRRQRRQRRQPERQLRRWRSR